MPDYDSSPLGGGLSQAFDAIANQVDQQKQRARQINSVREYLDSSDILPKYQSAGMDLDSLQGIAAGAVMKAKMAADQQKMQQEAVATAAAQQNLDASRSLGGFAQDYVNGPDVPPSPPGMPTPVTNFDRLNFALGRNKTAMASPHFAQSIDALQGMGTADAPVSWFTNPKTGATFATRKNEMMPAGIDPTVAAKNVPSHDVYNDAGDVVATAVWDGKKFVMKNIPPSQSGSNLDPAIDSSTGKPIPGMYYDGKKVIKAPGAGMSGGDNTLAPAIDRTTGKAIPNTYKNGDKVVHVPPVKIDPLQALLGGSAVPAGIPSGPAGSRKQVPMVGPKGELGYVDADKVQDALKRGLRLR